jgi:magnesium transporter
MRVMRLEGSEIKVGGQELAGPGAPIWVDLSPTPGELAFLAERFQFHPLALEDCLHEDQRAKLEVFPDVLFAVSHRLSLAPDDSGLEAGELSAFLTSGALVTVHGPPIQEVDAVFERCRAEPGLFSRGPAFVLYLLHDAITDLHFALVDHLTEEAEALAEEVASGQPGPGLAERIMQARRQHSLMRRRVGPQRELFAALARPGQALVGDQTAIYFRDVVDHLVRLSEEIDSGRELLASTMETLLSQANNRLTGVTTRLTLIATIFLPLNFVAGFFGMNLEILPTAVAVPLVMAAVVTLPAVMFLFFRKRGWLA